jgi:ion channel-forming bestrophin family protein
MISYNSKEWFTFIFRFHKAETFRTLLPLMFGISLYCLIIDYLILDCFQLSDDNNLKNITIMHSMLGFVISLLLVFRTNTAYDRWWEGRKQWGSLVNNSRNLALKLSSILEDKQHRLFFKRIIPHYSHVLNLHLKNQSISQELFDEFNINVELKKHKPNQVIKLMLIKKAREFRAFFI